jgi:hypothetical protein
MRAMEKTFESHQNYQKLIMKAGDSKSSLLIDTAMFKHNKRKEEIFGHFSNNSPDPSQYLPGLLSVQGSSKINFDVQRNSSIESFTANKERPFLQGNLYRDLSKASSNSPKGSDPNLNIMGGMSTILEKPGDHRT